MSLLRISELAERSGVPSSTLRYYERIGLVEPSGRAANGYRVYEESTLERLAFIRRAKRLRMSLDDASTLMEAWFAGDCEPLQDRLRAFATAQIGGLRRQIAEDSLFERQLERMLVRLGGGGNAPKHCEPDCGCDTDPLDAGDLAALPNFAACSLEGGAVDQRIADWHQLLAKAMRTEHTAGQLIAVFDRSEITEVVRLCAAEVACCPFFTFDLKIMADAVVLTIGVPPGAENLMGVVFGSGEGSTLARASVGPAPPMPRIGV